MSEWIRQITAVVLVVMIITLIVPEGKMGKSIKSFLPLLISIAIISPIISIKDVDFGRVLYGSNDELSYQDTFLDYVNMSKIEWYEQQCIDILTSYGIENADVKIIFNSDENLAVKIEKINVNLINSVISADKEHIDIVEMVKRLLSDAFNIEKGDVLVYGK